MSINLPIVIISAKTTAFSDSDRYVTFDPGQTDHDHFSGFLFCLSKSFQFDCKKSSKITLLDVIFFGGFGERQDKIVR